MALVAEGVVVGVERKNVLTYMPGACPPGGSPGMPRSRVDHEPPWRDAGAPAGSQQAP